MVGKAFDQDKSDTFLDRMVGMMNESSLSLIVSIGYKTGLFDVMGKMAPGASSDIAETAVLNERYVREWLGAMVTGKIVDYDPERQHYSLPAEHAAWLTREVGSNNFSSVMPFIPALAVVEDAIIDCFRNGGGVPYESFPSIHHVIADSSMATHDELLIDVALPTVPGLVERLEKGIQVADIGCGQGHVGNLLAGAFPKSDFTGFDFVAENVLAAREEAERLGLMNSRFEVRDITALDLAGAFDLITAFDAIHDQAKPDVVLRKTAEALKPDGLFMMVDIAASSHLEENIDHRMGPLLYTVSCMHCMTVSLALDGAGLGTVWGKELATKMLYEAGFEKVEVKEIEGYDLDYFYIASKGAA
jgi:SAM-dependent methyltransferase